MILFFGGGGGGGGDYCKFFKLFLTLRDDQRILVHLLTSYVCVLVSFFFFKSGIVNFIHLTSMLKGYSAYVKKQIKKTF